jgi:hypothetical protein
LSVFSGKGKFEAFYANQGGGLIVKIFLDIKRFSWMIYEKRGDIMNWQSVISKPV